MELVNFSAKDGVVLDGQLKTCTKNTDKVLIQVHGMTSNCFKKRDAIISSAVAEIGIDTLCFNNRGSDIAKYIKTLDDRRDFGGSAYEDVTDGYYDIVGAIRYVIDRGYKTIYLQGHSLGSTKVVYTYNKLQGEDSDILNSVKGIILLSLVDVVNEFKKYNPDEYLAFAKEKESKNELLDLMPRQTFMHPISVRTFLSYIKNESQVDFAKYSDEKYEYKVLNDIKIPVFYRWGTVFEMIEGSTEDLVKMLKIKLKGEKIDIAGIDGANHSYDGKEEILAEQIKEFLNKI